MHSALHYCTCVPNRRLFSHRHSVLVTITVIQPRADLGSLPGFPVQPKCRRWCASSACWVQGLALGLGLAAPPQPPAQPRPSQAHSSAGSGSYGPAGTSLSERGQIHRSRKQGVYPLHQYSVTGINFCPSITHFCLFCFLLAEKIAPEDKKVQKYIDLSFLSQLMQKRPCHLSSLLLYLLIQLFYQQF